jgi:hypothetical protein
VRCAALLAVAALVGCGSVSESDRVTTSPAEPRVIDLNWVERWPAAGLTFRVDRLVVRRDGWQLAAAVTNRSSVPYVIQRPHRPGEAMFGLVVLQTTTRKELRELTADFRKAPPFLEPGRLEPRPPRVLEARTTWRGVLSGPRILRRGWVIRVLFGRFVRAQGDPGYLLWVTEHAVRL